MPGAPAVMLAAALVIVGSCGPVDGAGPGQTPALELSIATGPGDALTFEPSVAVAPPGTTVLITFDNVSTQSHNLTFEAPIQGATRTIVEPGDTDSFVIRTPGPGRYTFVCTVHLDMRATLEVR